MKRLLLPLLAALALPTAVNAFWKNDLSVDFNGENLDIDNLTIPHKRCHQRNFVLFPISQIDPYWEHPILKKNVNVLIGQLCLKSRIEITRLNKNVNIKT